MNLDEPPAGLSITRAVPADRQTVFDLFAHWGIDPPLRRELFDASWDRVMASKDNRILIARVDGEAAGYVQFFPVVDLGFEPFWEVSELLVATGLRGKGIGKALMREVERLAAEAGIREIKLSSQVHRSAAHVFYEGLGYRYTKISKFYEKKLEAT